MSEGGFTERLAKETQTWVSDGIITAEQKELILNRYERAGSESSDRFITTISIMGAVLVGVGVILFVASNWDKIPSWGKLFLIYAVLVITYGAGFFLRYEKGNFPKVGGALIFLGSIIFGAGIFLIAQIYNVSSHYPNGMLMWGIGVLPLAYIARLKSILTLTLIDIIVWMTMEASFHVHGLYNPNVYVPLLFIAGATLWEMGLIHRDVKTLRALSAPYTIIGMLTTFFTAYILTFSISFSMLFSGHTVFYIAIFAVFVITQAAGIVVTGWDRERLYERVSLTGTLMLVFAFVIVNALFFKSSHTAVLNRGYLTLGVNVVFAIWIVATIYIGYVRQYQPYVNIGLLFFVLDVVARYFDFFWRLLPRSLFFVIGGMLLLFGGIMLEKRRRRLVSAFSNEEAN
ncbi:MAG: DUF2157 domain-containing protein [Nitrospirae bacterium]|nr:DUF2157 domain-containing protein [Nitrospirota bacterium]